MTPQRGGALSPTCPAARGCTVTSGPSLLTGRGTDRPGPLEPERLRQDRGRTASGAVLAPTSSSSSGSHLPYSGATPGPGGAPGRTSAKADRLPVAWPGGVKMDDGAVRPVTTW